MAKRAYRIILMRADDSQFVNAPQLPAVMTVQPENNFWFTIWPLGRVNNPNQFVHARIMVRGSGPQLERACYVFMGTEAQMQELHDRADAARTAGATWIRIWTNLAELRADGTAAAVAVKTAWRDERPQGDVGSIVRLFTKMAGFDEDDGE